ncbi:MAG: type II CAAX endopeptidase family protein [Luteibacter sp.]
MQTATILYTPPADAPGWKRALLYSAGARIGLLVIGTIVFTMALGKGLSLAGLGGKGMSPVAGGIVEALIRAVPPLLAYVLLVRLVERRHLSELSARGVRAGVAALVGGVALMSLVVGVLWLLGAYEVIGPDSAADWPKIVFGAGIGAAVGEETICRGGLFRACEEALGTGWALLISSLFFGFAHAFNPHATVGTSLAIALEAGVMLGLLYAATRSLWACIGLHAGWNITQSLVYGVPTSGTTLHGLVASRLAGPGWLSGGEFGAEASIVAILACGAVSVGLFILARRRGRLVAPAWKRRRTRIPAVPVAG